MFGGICRLELNGFSNVCGISPETSLNNVAAVNGKFRLTTSKMETLFPTAKASMTSFGAPVSSSEGLPLFCDPQPVLPPGLRESERMMLVERWINNIPSDLPHWAQTSLNRLVLLPHPKSFPDENSPTDNQTSADYCSGAYDSYSSALHLSNDGSPSQRDQQQTKLSLKLGSAMDSCSKHILFSNSLAGHCPQPHGLSPASPFIGGTWRPSNQCSPSQVLCNGLTPIENGSAKLFNQFRDRSRNFAAGSSSRLFDELETQVIVKLFNDFFTNGCCPSLRDVRHRIANSILQVSRNATSIRAKVKRMQATGGWADYVVS